MIKKLILAGLIVGAMAAPSAFALNTVTLSDGPGTTGGGEFNAVSSANGNFITFCLEYTQHIQLNTPLPYTYTISDKTESSGDYLSKATAWLYNAFLNNELVGYIHNNTEADRLQKAIWWLEDEANGVGQIAYAQENNTYVLAALAATGVNGKMDAAMGEYGVKVMNVWLNSDGTGDKQDQLIRIPRVPDGGTTLALLGMSMGFVAFASRRLRS